MSPFDVQPQVGKWYFELAQSFVPAGAYDTAEDAEQAGRAFAREAGSLGVLVVGRWVSRPVPGGPVKIVNLRKEIEDRAKNQSRNHG